MFLLFRCCCFSTCRVLKLVWKFVSILKQMKSFSNEIHVLNILQFLEIKNKQLVNGKSKTNTATIVSTGSRNLFQVKY